MDFLKGNVENYLDKKYAKMIEYYSINHAHTLSHVECVNLYQQELDTISKLPNKNLKNIAITLLCVAKYNHEVNPNNDYWVNLTIQQLNVMSMVKEKNITICDYIHELYKLGLIKFSQKVSSISIQVKFALESVQSKNVALKIHSFDTIVKEYNAFLKTI
jgi:hypothetical protein